MKAALVIGGSNGIGLSIVKSLIKRNYFVYILDITLPDDVSLSSKSYQFHYFDMASLDLSIVELLSSMCLLDTVIITAGIGRVAPFKSLDDIEVNKIMTINATSTIRLLKLFNERIEGNKDFYFGVMGSIAGMVVSPLFSVYSASKAALCRFIESVNIELECKGIKNRILNISPGAIEGTKFNNGKNDYSKTKELAEDILVRLFSKETLFIPNYDNVYKDVLERYCLNPKQFGIDSYHYKLNSGRVDNRGRSIIGYLSGTFDLFHIGHLNLLKRAREQCDYLIVGVHRDASHKGKETFISFEERKSIVESCKYVDKAVMSCSEDNEAWTIYHYNKLFVGSDYKGTERFIRYEQYFEDKNVEIVYFPYTEGTSSSKLRYALSK